MAKITQENFQAALCPLWSLNKIDRLRWGKMSKKKKKSTTAKLEKKMHQSLWRKESSCKDRYCYLSVLSCTESIS